MDDGRPHGPKVSLLHAVPGRLRFLAPEFIGKSEAMEAFLETIADVPGLVRVVGRPATGALILEYEGDIAALIPSLIERGRLTFVRKASLPPLSQQLRFAFALIDQKLAARSDGALDAHTGAALLLGGLSVFQASLRRLFGPSTTLLMSAIAAATRGDAPRNAPVRSRNRPGTQPCSTVRRSPSPVGRAWNT